jgi:hypothetical protein
MEHPARITTGPAPTNTLRLDDELALIVRPVEYEDHGLILSSWVAHFMNSPLGTAVSRPIYKREQRWLVEKLLASEQALVAVDAKDAHHVFGWIVGRRLESGDGVLHYAFCKSQFRGFGIGRFLFRELLGTPRNVFFTHWRESIPRKHPNFVFDPFILLRVGK